MAPARRLRLLHVVDNLNYGGMERIIAELVRRADRDRFDVHVLALSYLGHFAEGLAEIATLHVAQPMSHLSILRPASLAHDIAAIAPDVVHIHSGVWFKAARAAAIARVPTRVYTDHGRQYPDPWLNRALDRTASARTHHVVAVSDPLRDHMRGFVADPRRLTVIRNGVDTEHFAPRAPDGSLHGELGLDPSTPIIGSVGRLEPVKGYEVAVPAFAALMANWDCKPRPVLVLIGDGSERQRLERDAARLGVAERIVFRGWRTDIERHLAEFALFTMSSHSEGTSVSLLEAMSSGLCPVVTRVGGNAAVLGEPLAHRLVPPNDPDALARAWREALDDRDARERDACAARRRVLDDYSLDAMVRAYEALYVTPAA
jgi:glycosyltransferase involved in cell wall biosynthesis